MENLITEEVVHVKGQPKKMVIFLHGYIDDAKSLDKKLNPLLDSLDNIVLVLPQSPKVCEILDSKRQWYSMHAFDPEDSRRSAQNFDDFTKVYEKAAQGMFEAFGYLNVYIKKKLKEYHLSYKDLYICGFSQGASVAIYTSLMLKKRIAGCVSFSGMISPLGFLQKHHNNTPNILLIHGKADNLVRFAALDFTRQNLEGIGCVVSSYAMENEQHKITQDGLMVASGFINNATIKKLAI